MRETLDRLYRQLCDALEREPEPDARRSEDQERFYRGGRHDGLCEALAILDEVKRQTAE
jgi:hypothetical protein